MTVESLQIENKHVTTDQLNTVSNENTSTVLRTRRQSFLSLNTHPEIQQPQESACTQKRITPAFYWTATTGADPEMY